jgi:hypothetical protein
MNKLTVGKYDIGLREENEVYAVYRRVRTQNSLQHTTKEKIPSSDNNITTMLTGMMDNDNNLNEAMFRSWDKKKKEYQD